MTRYRAPHKLGGCNHHYKYSQVAIRFVGITENGLPVHSCNKCGETWAVANALPVVNKVKHGKSKMTGEKTDSIKNLPIG